MFQQDCHEVVSQFQVELNLIRHNTLYEGLPQRLDLMRFLVVSMRLSDICNALIEHQAELEQRLYEQSQRLTANKHRLGYINWLLSSQTRPKPDDPSDDSSLN